MSIYTVVFYPPEGERLAPYDILLKLPPQVQASIVNRLEKLEILPFADWPSQWFKKHTSDIWQLTSGAYRVMFVLDAPEIVVLHIFRKKGEKTATRDIQRAISNYQDYLQEIGK